MTLAVDPSAYYKAATNCFDAAEALWDSFRFVFSELSSCGAMAGIDEDGRAWAANYNQSAADAVGLFEETHGALYAYGVALNDLGFVHAQSDAKLKGTAQPERPKDPAAKGFGPYSVPAAAGGSGIGLAETAVEVLDAINCPLPDGDTTKLAKAADAWDRLGTIYQNTNAKDKITISVTLFDQVKSDDVGQVREDLKSIEASIGDLLDTCKAISKSCAGYKDSIEELRKQILGYIESIVREAAIKATVTIIATCITGVGGIIAGASAVESARRWSVTIKAAVTAWRARKALQLRGLADDAVAKMVSARKKMRELRDRILRKKDGKDGGQGGPNGPKKRGKIDESEKAFSPEERKIADLLADEGKDVKGVPEGAQRTPDATVDGVPTEFKTLTDGASNSTVKNALNSASGQAQSAIIDGRGSGITEDEARRGLNRFLGASPGKMTNIRIVGDGWEIVWP
ncbi:CdiA C-terminal domain-containing protein [Nocardia xishanensis]|uniref:CdiA C-terminal domain-containing protein n=1 Tax=Nocardia xishanensis TaxID=238964 RepID=UPI00082C23AC|nr:hypothetical protein [Nocardia xishanensis]